MELAFSWDIDQWLFFGGYPGVAPFIDQEDIWSRYIADPLIETVPARDVLQLQTVAKPALLRHLFLPSAVYPAQILSYNKMLGQLQDSGDTTTLAHYLKLLEAAMTIPGGEGWLKMRLALTFSITLPAFLILFIIGDSLDWMLNSSQKHQDKPKGSILIGYPTRKSSALFGQD